MTRRRSLSSLAGRLTAALALLAVVALVRLAGLGLLVTQGTSMEPEFTTGDLAVTYTVGRYRVGDVVAYHSRTLNNTVLHRIVQADGTRFVTRGDNNAWVDPDQPTRADIRGRVLTRIPWLGTLVTSARHAMTDRLSVAVAAGLLVVASFSAPGPHRRRSSRWATRPAGAHRRRGPSGRRLVLPGVVAGLGLLSVASVSLLARPAAPAYSRVAVQEPTAAPHAERLTLDYSARTPAVATYPDGLLHTGSPIFVNAVRTLTVTVSHVGGQDAVTTLSAELGHPTGWRRPVRMTNLTSRRTSTGTTASARLDVRAVTDLLKRFASETNLPAPGASLALIATAGEWSMRSELTYDGVQFQAKGQAFSATRPAANGGIDPSVASARSVTSASPARALAILPRWAAAALPLVLLPLGIAGARRRRRKDQPSLSPDRLVPVASYQPADGRTIVDVRDAAQLIRSAENSDRPILLHTTPGGHTYIFDDGAVIYRLPDVTAVATGR